jgi:D-inositol-3-phosphate glycosyltransferase
MKIVIIGPVYPLRGGIADFNHALANSLINQGHSVTIFSFTLQYPKLLFPGKTQYIDHHTNQEKYDVIETINSINPYSWRKTAKEIVGLNPDLIITRFWIPFMGAALGTIHRLIKRRLKETPIIAITDNIIPHESRVGDRSLTKYFLKSCDRFVVMSKQVGQDLKKFISSPKYLCLPHPIYDIFGEIVEPEEAKSTLELPKEKKIILFFGFIRNYKGLDLLLEAIALCKSKSQFVLLVAGEFYEDKEAYLRKIKSLEIENQIILHDRFIPKELVSFYFCASNLVAQTYRTATQSGVTQIAYHFNKPILVTNVGGLNEIVTHNQNGYVCPVDIHEISSCIDDFFLNDREIPFSEQSSKLKEQFSWNHFVNELIPFSTSDN